MQSDDLVKCFQHTLKFSVSPGLRQKTITSIHSSKVYAEKYISKEPLQKPVTNGKNDKVPFSDQTISLACENSYCIVVSEDTTFVAAKKYVSMGKVAVLNFANPRNPGGGVCFGAMAQESVCAEAVICICVCVMLLCLRHIMTIIVRKKIHFSLIG